MFLATSNLSVHTEHKTADATQSQQIRRYLMFNAMKSRILEQIRCHSGWGLIIRLSSELTIWQIDVNLNLEYIYLSKFVFEKLLFFQFQIAISIQIQELNWNLKQI